MWLTKALTGVTSLSNILASCCMAKQQQKQNETAAFRSRRLAYLTSLGYRLLKITLDMSTTHCCLPARHTWKSRREVGKSSRFLMSRSAMQLGDSTTGRGVCTTTGRTKL